MNDEPCMCGTPFTCLASTHDRPWIVEEAELEARRRRDRCVLARLDAGDRDRPKGVDAAR